MVYGPAEPWKMLRLGTPLLLPSSLLSESDFPFEEAAALLSFSGRRWSKVGCSGEDGLEAVVGCLTRQRMRQQTAGVRITTHRQLRRSAVFERGPFVSCFHY